MSVAIRWSNRVACRTAAPARRRWGLRLAAAVGGAALALAFPEAGLWWWAYVGLVPVLLLVATAPDRREALWRCWLAGCGFFLVLHHWLLPQLSVFAVPLVMVVGLVWLPWGLAAWWLLRPPRSSARAAAAIVVVPAAWVLIEYVRAWERLGGSWGMLGSTQWQVRPVLAVAALGGVWALSFLLAATGTALAVAVVPGVGRRVRVASGVFALVLVGMAAGYGVSRPAPDVVGTLRIGAVQPGRVHAGRERLAAHEDMSRELAAVDTDVIVWGQSSVGFDLETAGWARERLVALARELDRPLLVNVDARSPSGRISKTMVVVRPDGLAETYTKQRLVPFGEYIPLRWVLGWVEGFTEAAEEDRAPGTTLITLQLGPARVGPLISYESTFPDMRRSHARAGVHVTLVQAAATTFQGTWALPQQASFEAVRAVESGRPAVLVAVSGTSAAFDARGRRLAWVDQDDTRAWTVDVPLAREDTLFVRWGDWVPASCLVVLLVAAGAAVAGARPSPTGRRRSGEQEGMSETGVRLHRWRDRPLVGVGLLMAAAGFAQFSPAAALGDVAEHFGELGDGDTIKEQAGLPGSVLGGGLAVIRLSALLALPLAGLADRVGRRRTVLTFASLGLVVTIAAAGSPSYWWFVVAFAAARPFLTATDTLGEVMAAEHTAASDRAKAVAMAAAAYGVGAGLVAALRGLAGESLGFRAVFGLAALPLAAVAIASRLVTEPDRFRQRAFPEATRRLVPVLRAVQGPRRRRLAVLATIAFATALITAPVGTLLFVYAENVVGLSRAVTGGLVVAAGAIGLVGLMMGRLLADRVGRRPTAAVALVLLAAAGVLTYSGSAPALVAGYLGGVLFGSAYGTSAITLTTELFPTSVRAAVAGWLVVAGVLGATSGLTLVGTMADVLGSFTAATVVVCIPGGLAAGLFALVPETRGLDLERTAPEELSPSFGTRAGR